MVWWGKLSLGLSSARTSLGTQEKIPCVFEPQCAYPWNGCLALVSRSFCCDGYSSEFLSSIPLHLALWRGRRKGTGSGRDQRGKREKEDGVALGNVYLPVMQGVLVS